MFTPTVFVLRYFTESCKIFTAYAIITDEKSIGDLPGEIQTELIRRYISSGKFFWRVFSVCKTVGVYFFLSIEVATGMKITDYQYFNRCFPSVMLSVKFIPTDSVSYADGNNPSVKLLNVVVITLSLIYLHSTKKNIYSKFILPFSLVVHCITLLEYYCISFPFVYSGSLLTFAFHG
jgi:hypothetical protein